MSSTSPEPRFAVLHGLSTARPVAVAFATPEGVRVRSTRDFGIPALISEPYRVVQRDLSTVEYRPTDNDYFDQVLVELSRTFQIGERSHMDDVSTIDQINVFNQRVMPFDVRIPRTPRPYAEPRCQAVYRSRPVEKVVEVTSEEAADERPYAFAA